MKKEVDMDEMSVAKLEGYQYRPQSSHTKTEMGTDELSMTISDIIRDEGTY
jgi:hypothetical protein